VNDTKEVEDKDRQEPDQEKQEKKQRDNKALKENH